jgi:hypothetical protein
MAGRVSDTLGNRSATCISLDIGALTPQVPLGSRYRREIGGTSALRRNGKSKRTPEESAGAKPDIGFGVKTKDRLLATDLHGPARSFGPRALAPSATCANRADPPDLKSLRPVKSGGAFGNGVVESAAARSFLRPSIENG